jgi:hypothetical protein
MRVADRRLSFLPRRRSKRHRSSQTKSWEETDASICLSATLFFFGLSKICISDSSSYPVDDPNATVPLKPNLGKKRMQLYAWLHMQDVNIISFMCRQVRETGVGSTLHKAVVTCPVTSPGMSSYPNDIVTGIPSQGLHVIQRLTALLISNVYCVRPVEVIVHASLFIR